MPSAWTGQRWSEPLHSQDLLHRLMWSQLDNAVFVSFQACNDRSVISPLKYYSVSAPACSHRLCSPRPGQKEAQEAASSTCVQTYVEWPNRLVSHLATVRKLSKKHFNATTCAAKNKASARH